MDKILKKDDGEKKAPSEEKGKEGFLDKLTGKESKDGETKDGKTADGKEVLYHLSKLVCAPTHDELSAHSL